MKNKGFTLIELLAVIVILAIIALIAVPIILNIIGDAKGEATERSIELYANAIKNAVADYSLSHPTEEDITFDDIKDSIEYEGNKVECNVARIYEDGTIYLDDCKIDGKKVDYSYGKYSDNSGASIPELVDGLTPVIYDSNSKQWKIADAGKAWYDYNKKEWANAVILSESGKTKHFGDTLTLPTSTSNASNSDVLAMFVWIPRYSYTISDTAQGEDTGTSYSPKYLTPDEIDIKFIGTDTIENGTATYTGDNPSNWYTHPAFTFGSDTLSGIWVGKFETGEEKYGAKLSCTDENCEESDDIRILPNVYSLKSNSVSKCFFASRSMGRSDNAFGINSSTTDSHMMKNSEWGAVAYLSHSKYGKEGEVYINNCRGYTGIGADNANDSEDSSKCSKDENKYNGSKGVNASTTGNVYGVYDMSGGMWEYVMGYLTTNASSTTWGSTPSSNYAGFTQAPDEKYYDNYTTTNADDYKGHALGETKAWYGDDHGFVQGYPWLARGYGYYSTSVAGVFAYTSQPGSGDDGYGYNSFRIVLVPTN